MVPVTALAFFLFGCSGNDCDKEARTLEESRRAPATLEVSGVEKDGNLVLTANLEVRGDLPGDPVLKLVLPRGASVVEGKETETLVNARSGTRVERTYVIRGDWKGVEVVLSSSARGRNMTLKAQWPPLERRPAKVNEGRPIKPVKVHGVIIDDAIPINNK